MEQMFRMNRRQFLQALGSAGAMSIAGSKFAWAAEGKIVKVRMWNEWFSFDPIIGISGSDFMHAFMSYERLVGYNTGTQWGWHLEAAESIGFDSDTEVRFRLRPGIRWSGGYGEALRKTLSIQLSDRWVKKVLKRTSVNGATVIISTRS